MNKEQKILSVVAVAAGVYLVYKYSKSNMRKKSVEKTDPSTSLSAVIPTPPNDNGMSFVGQPLATIVGVKSPSQITWSDFNTMITDSNNALIGATTTQMLDEQTRASNFLVSIGWDGVYNYYRKYLANEVLSNEVAFALNINAGFQLIPQSSQSPFAPSVPTFSPAPAPVMCCTTGAVTTSKQPMNVTTVPAVIAQVAQLTCSTTPPTPMVPTPSTGGSMSNFIGGSRNNREVNISTKER